MLPDDSEDERRITIGFKGFLSWSFSYILIIWYPDILILCIFRKDDNWHVELLTDFNTAFAPAVNLTYEKK